MEVLAMLTLMRAAAVSVLLLSAVVTAAPAASRTDARQLLTPMANFERAMMRERPALADRAAVWAATAAPCLKDGYAKVKAGVDAGTLTPVEGTTYSAILFMVAVDDIAVELSGPLDRELANAQSAYARMRPADRVLRAGARAKARELGALRRVGNVDTCAF